MRIIEILGRSEQGATQPFICRAEDQAIYYVKGRFAGYWALCCEWVAGELARRWNLPVAPFSLVEIPSALIQGSVRTDAHELGSGLAFGSKQVENSLELTWREIEVNAINADLSARILVYDWWISNADRQLSQLGGNPNLLWTESDKRLHLIDHNLAFSWQEVPETLLTFAADHVFGRLICGGRAQQNKAAVSAALVHLKSFWNDNNQILTEVWECLPDEWIESVPPETLAHLKSHLGSINSLEAEDYYD